MYIDISFLSYYFIIFQFYRIIYTSASKRKSLTDRMCIVRCQKWWTLYYSKDINGWGAFALLFSIYDIDIDTTCIDSSDIGFFFINNTILSDFQRDTSGWFHSLSSWWYKKKIVKDNLKKKGTMIALSFRKGYTVVLCSQSETKLHW